jgi:hypothetical protein
MHRAGQKTGKAPGELSIFGLAPGVKAKQSFAGKTGKIPLTPFGKGGFFFATDGAKVAKITENTEKDEKDEKNFLTTKAQSHEERQTTDFLGRSER